MLYIPFLADQQYECTFLKSQLQKNAPILKTLRTGAFHILPIQL